MREIARAFLADEAAIAQRLVRAKRQIRDRGLTLDMPAGADLTPRLDSVLDVIYLIFNEGYAAHEGEDLIRHDLCGEALRLGRLVAASSLAEPRVHALVALMAFQAARLPARVDALGDLVLLDDQDRSLWDQRLIALGFHHFDRSMAGDEVSPISRRGGHRRHPRPRRRQLADDPRPLRRSDEIEPFAGGRAEPRRGDRESAWTRAASTPCPKTRNCKATISYLAVRGHLLSSWGDAAKPPTRSVPRWNASARNPSAASCKESSLPACKKKFAANPQTRSKFLFVASVAKKEVLCYPSTPSPAPRTACDTPA